MTGSLLQSHEKYYSLQIAVEDLRFEIQEQSSNSCLKSASLLPMADEMITTMDTIMHMLQ